MGLQYHKIKRKPSQLLGLTGLTKERFEFLAGEFYQDWDSYISHYTLEGEPRQRRSSVRNGTCLWVT